MTLGTKAPVSWSPSPGRHSALGRTGVWVVTRKHDCADVDSFVPVSVLVSVWGTQRGLLALAAVEWRAGALPQRGWKLFILYPQENKGSEKSSETNPGLRQTWKGGADCI